MQELEWLIRRTDGTEQLLDPNDPLIAAAKKAAETSGSMDGESLSVPLPDVYRARQGLVKDEWKQTEKDSWNPSVGTGVLPSFARATQNARDAAIETIGVGLTEGPGRAIKAIDNDFAQSIGDSLLRGGEHVRDFTDNQRPWSPETEGPISRFMTKSLADGVGSTVGFGGVGAATALAAAPLGLAAAGTAIAATATTALMGASVNGAHAAHTAQLAGATDDEINEVFWLNAAAGTTEALPLKGILGKLLGTKVASRMIKDLLMEGTEEALQEAFQTIVEAAVAKNVYDPEREIWDYSAIGESAATGGTVGALMSFLSGVVSRRGGRGITPPAGSDPTEAPPNRRQTPPSESAAAQPMPTTERELVAAIDAYGLSEDEKYDLDRTGVEDVGDETDEEFKIRRLTAMLDRLQKSNKTPAQPTPPTEEELEDESTARAKQQQKELNDARNRVAEDDSENRVDVTPEVMPGDVDGTSERTTNPPSEAVAVAEVTGPPLANETLPEYTNRTAGDPEVAAAAEDARIKAEELAATTQEAGRLVALSNESISNGIQDQGALEEARTAVQSAKDAEVKSREATRVLVEKLEATTKAAAPIEVAETPAIEADPIVVTQKSALKAVKAEHEVLYYSIQEGVVQVSKTKTPKSQLGIFKKGDHTESGIVETFKSKKAADVRLKEMAAALVAETSEIPNASNSVANSNESAIPIPEVGEVPTPPTADPTPVDPVVGPPVGYPGSELSEAGKVDEGRPQDKWTGDPKTIVGPGEAATQPKSSGLPTGINPVGTGEKPAGLGPSVAAPSVPNQAGDPEAGGTDGAGAVPRRVGDATADTSDGVEGSEAERLAAYVAGIPGYLDQVPGGKNNKAQRKALAKNIADGLKYLEDYRHVLDEVSADIGIPVVIRFVHDPKNPSIGIGAEFNGNVLNVDPATLGKQLKLVEKKHSSIWGWLSRVNGLQKGIEALFEEEMLHLASFKVLIKMHAESGSTESVEDWMANFSNEILESSATNFKTLILGMYGETDYSGIELIRTYLQYIRNQGEEKVFTEEFTKKLDGTGPENQLKKAFAGILKMEEFLPKYSKEHGATEEDPGVTRLTEIARITQEWIAANSASAKVRRGPKEFSQVNESGTSREADFYEGVFESFKREARMQSNNPDSPSHRYYKALWLSIPPNVEVTGEALWSAALSKVFAEESATHPDQKDTQTVLLAAEKAAKTAELNYDANDDATSEAYAEAVSRLARVKASVEAAEKLQQVSGFVRVEVEMPAEVRATFNKFTGIFEGNQEANIAASLKRSGFDEEVAASAAKKARRNIGNRFLDLSEDRPFSEVFTKDGVNIKKAIGYAIREAVGKGKVQNKELSDANVASASLAAFKNLESEVELDTADSPQVDPNAAARAEDSLKQEEETPAEPASDPSGIEFLFENMAETFAEENTLTPKEVQLFQEWVATKPWGPVSQLVENVKTHAEQLESVNPGEGGAFNDLFGRYAKYVGKFSGRRAGGAAVNTGAPPIQVEIEAENSRIAEMARAKIEAHRKQAGRLGTGAYQKKMYANEVPFLTRLLDYVSRELAAEEDPPSSILDERLKDYVGDISEMSGEEVEALQAEVRLEMTAKEIVDATGDVVDAEATRDSLVGAGSAQDIIDWADKQLATLRSDLEAYVKAAPEEASSRADEMLVYLADEIEIKSSAKTLTNDSIKAVFIGQLGEVDPITSALQYTLGEIKEVQDILAYELKPTDDAEKVTRARAAAEKKLEYLQTRLEMFRRHRTKTAEDLAEQQKEFDKTLAELDEATTKNRAASGEILAQMEKELIASKTKGRVGATLPTVEQQALYDHVSAMYKMAESMSQAEDGSPLAEAYDVTQHPDRNTKVEAYLQGVLNQFNTDIAAVARQLGVTKHVFIGMAQNMESDAALKGMMKRLTNFLKSKPDVDRLRALAEINAAPKRGEKKEIATKLARAERNALRNFSREQKELSKKAVKLQIKIRTAQKVVDIFDGVSQTQGFRELSDFLDNPGDHHAEMERMIIPSSSLTKFMAFGNTKALEIRPDASLAVRAQWFDQVSAWSEAASKYITSWDDAHAAFLLDSSKPTPEEKGFDGRVVRGLRNALDEKVGSYLDYLSLESPTQFARVPRGFAWVNSGTIPLGKAFFQKLFGQLDQVLKYVPIPEAKLFRSELNVLSRAERNANAVNQKHDDFAILRDEALRAHGFTTPEQYDIKVFQPAAILGRQNGSPVEVGYTLPTGYTLNQLDINFLRKQEQVFIDVQRGMGRDAGVERKGGGRTFVRKARAVGDFSPSRRPNSDLIRDVKAAIEAAFYKEESSEIPLRELIRDRDSDLDTSEGSNFAAFWDSQPEILQSMILDSQLPAADRKFKRSKPVEDALNHMFSTGVKIDSLEEFQAGIEEYLSGKSYNTGGVYTETNTETAKRLVEAELKSYMLGILGPVATEDIPGTATEVSMRTTASQFTRSANILELPTRLYRYGAGTSLEWAALISGPRTVAEVKVLEAISRLEKGIDKHLELAVQPGFKAPRAVRNDAEYIQMLQALKEQLSLKKQSITTSENERRRLDPVVGDVGPLGSRHDATSVAHAIVLTPTTTVAGNAPLSVLGVFNIHAKLHGVLSALQTTLAGMVRIGARSLLYLGESTAVNVAWVMDGVAKTSSRGFAVGQRMLSSSDRALVEKELGKGSVERWVNSWIVAAETNYLSRLQLTPTLDKVELSAKGITNRSSVSNQLKTANLERGYAKARRKNGGIAPADGSEFTLTQQLLSAVSTASDKVGMGWLDLVVNQMALESSRAEMKQLDTMAGIYGQVMAKKNPGQSYKAGVDSWRVKLGDDFTQESGLSGDRIAFYRNFLEKTGTPFEEILWKIHTYNTNSKASDAALSVPLSEWSNEKNDLVGATNRLGDDLNDLQARIVTLYIEEINAPSSNNRSMAPRTNPFFRLTQPLMGYTADFIQKSWEVYAGGDPDREGFRRLLEVLGRAMFGAIAFTIAGLLANQGRETVKRHLSARSTGSAVLSDSDFWDKMKTLFDPENGALARDRMEASIPLVVALASATPFVGDFVLMAASHVSTTSSRGHILELGGKSIAINLMHDAVVAGMATVNAQVTSPSANVSTAAGDFFHRWIPFYDAASYHVFNRTDKWKYYGGYALKAEAIRLGITEPRKQIRMNMGVMSTDKLWERTIASAVGKRDEAGLGKAVADYVAFLQEDKGLNLSDARKRAGRQLRNLSPLNRASPKKLTRREKNQILEAVTGKRREPIDAALADYDWVKKNLYRLSRVRIKN